MSVLLPDESYCTSELGLILYDKRKTYGFFAEVTSVKEPTSMFGFVEYEISLTLTPHDSISFAPRKFIVNTRFKELNRLHTQLCTIHRQLYLKEVFPGFAPPKVFGAAEPETIAERKKAINTFLNFVLKNEVLCKARCFQSFINNAQEIKKDDELPESSSEKSVVNDLIALEDQVGDEINLPVEEDLVPNEAEIKEELTEQKGE